MADMVYIIQCTGVYNRLGYIYTSSGLLVYNVFKLAQKGLINNGSDQIDMRLQ